MYSTRSGLLGGIAVIVLWALLWTWFLIGVTAAAAEKRARQAPEFPGLARFATFETWFEG